MKISARNLIKNRIVSVESWKVMSNVKVQVPPNPDITTATLAGGAEDDLQLN